MLKRKISKADFEALDPALKAYYKADGDDYVIQIEGMVGKEKLEEFRDSNVQLKEELKKFKDVDLDKYQQLLADETDILAGRTKGGKTVDQIIAERTEKMRQDHEKKVRELEEANTKKDGELNRLKITDAAILIGQKKGLKASAADDLKFRAEKAFKLDEKGRPVVMEGDKVKFGKSGDPMGLDEWMDELIGAAGHLFEASSGTGAANGQGTGNGGTVVRNPWKTETRNLTEQGAIQKKDPALAKRMKAEAGVK